MNPDISDSEAQPTANAVSLFGSSGGVNDFPVLKAFQEYIDAEQAKARKRMFGLSIFFIVLLVVVVVTFTIIMTSVIGRNQALSDRLLDIALREKNSAQPVVNVQQPVPSPVVQPVLPTPHENPELVRLREELQREKDARQADQTKRDKEKIESLTAALAKAQQQPVSPTPVVVTTSPQPVLQQPLAESAEVVRLREELRREKEERKAEQVKRAQEKKEAEKEAFLRRQYPDYYAKEDARKAAETARRATPPLPAPASVPAPAAVEPVPPPAPQLAVQHQPVAVPNSEDLNRQREALDREEERIRRRQEEEKRKAEQGKPSPSRATPKVAPPTPVKAITYFDESQPGEDPELAELLSRTAARTPPKATAKPAPQPTAKPTPQPTAKPAPKPSARPAVTQQPTQKTEQSTHKTETLAIGGAAGGGSIPWLIELPVQ